VTLGLGEISYKPFVSSKTRRTRRRI